MSDGTVGDTGGGTVSIDVLTAGATKYIVVEWNDAQIYGDTSGNQYSFSVWFKAGDTEEVTFNYFKVPTIPAALTIGAENIGGSIGATYHFNGTGGTVAANDYVEISAASAGNVELAYKVKATEFNLGQADMLDVVEDSTASMNVLLNDTKADQKVARVQVSGDGMTAKAQNLIDVMPSGALTKAMISKQPTNGTAMISEAGELTYTPKANFFGKDTLSYTAEDAAGNVITPTTVSLTVSNVNDAPTVNPSAVNGLVNTTLTVKSNAVDVDQDTLTYTWTQTSGPAVQFDATKKNVTFVPTEVATYSFSVVASDGVLSSNMGEASVKSMPRDDDAGSLGWLTTLLLPLAAFRRRKH
ncbi:Ig-like domain-containing protein [Shewanella sp. OMA3-2]|uniref:Ig-like domain-containing protein n=1 Tax=Shewanella sp. OMA3-2 TaxID=2908650 RepID=UPI001F31EA07|nr:Ig-like domain-containing protein [Shewanella sp. OMA3-2]UJF22734.1 cadherin-like domain-containing protein [Shewanella sp. OMA3-2]